MNRKKSINPFKSIAQPITQVFGKQMRLLTTTLGVKEQAEAPKEGLGLGVRVRG